MGDKQIPGVLWQQGNPGQEVRGIQSGNEARTVVGRVYAKVVSAHPELDTKPQLGQNRWSRASETGEAERMRGGA